jgi:hypothetical protein
MVVVWNVGMIMVVVMLRESRSRCWGGDVGR